MPYHDRRFLNPIGMFATSQITAFHGKDTYMSGDEVKEYILTKLVISDCHKSVHLHLVPGDPHDVYVDKLRLIADVCNKFADYLDNLKGEEGNA